MPEFIKKAENDEKKRLTLSDVQLKYVNATTARTTWDTDAEDCRKIRDNELPLRGDISGAEGFTGKFYVDNWISKANDFRISRMASYDTYIDLKSDDANPYNQDRDLLEMTINFTMDKFRYQERRFPPQIAQS